VFNSNKNKKRLCLNNLVIKRNKIRRKKDRSVRISEYIVRKFQKLPQIRKYSLFKTIKNPISRNLKKPSFRKLKKSFLKIQKT